MSLILDALRKLDREKSPLRKPTGEITTEILRTDSPRPRKSSGFYFASLGLTAIAAAAVTYAAIVGLDFFPKSSPPPSSGPAEKSEQAAPAILSPKLLPGVQSEISQTLQEVPKPAEIKSLAIPAVPPSSDSSRTQASKRVKSSKPEAFPVALPQEPKVETKKEIKRAPQEIRKGGESKPVSATAPEEKVSRIIPKEENLVFKNERKPAEKIVTSPPTAEPPSLKLSGILWQDHPSERRAVINGNFVGEGAMVEGAKVLEIHPTHVRLSYNGRPFEISINLIGR
jgi:hypothetical protein